MHFNNIDMLKHILLILMLSIFGSAISKGEVIECPSPDGKSKEQIFKEIQEFKLKYLAQEMDLRDDQQQKFFDLYNEMSAKRFAAMREARRLEKKVKKNKDATEDDYKTVTEAINKAKAEDASIEKEYDAKFSVFLSQKQIFKMKSAEESFRKKMEEMRHKKHTKKRGK